MLTKKFIAMQIYLIKKLIAFNFIIEYCRKRLNLANVSSKRFDIIKLDDNENNNDNFLFILRYKLRNSKCQSKQKQI